MFDDGHAPTIPDTHPAVSSPGSAPKAPDPRYSLRTLLGKGGMGEVWLARDDRIDREIAIKLMRGGTDNPDAVARFLREARVQGRLEHPSVVPVHDLGTDPRAPYFAMKRLSGTTLADVLAAGDQTRWPRRTLLARFIDVCLAVELAHQRGVVHRDLKPANIMLGDFGETYVLDWGLARMRGDTDDPVLRQSDSHDSGAGQTEAGAMLGTPGYMPPEQMRGDAVDHRADIYALGCTLFEIITGSPAIARDKVYETTLAAPHHRPSTRAADVPPELDELCVRATAADIASRLDSARTLADSVQRFLDGDRDLERRRALASEHLGRARELITQEGERARADAMREAGSALALDAANPDAQAILARLLLDPPKTVPAEAARKLDDERHRSAHTVLRNASLAYLLFLVSLPVIYLLGVSSGWPLVVVGAEIAALFMVCFAASVRRWRVGTALALAILAGHCSLIATLGIFLGPLFLVPVLVFGSSTIMVTVQTVREPALIAGFHLAALLVPLVLEWLGILPPSYAIRGHALVLEPPEIAFAPTAMLFVLVATVVIQLVSNLWVLDAQRRLQDTAQEQLHVQAWQLAQLVRSSGPTA